MTPECRTFTDEVIDPKVAEIMRSRTPAERTEIIFQLWDFMFKQVRDMARSRHPEWTEEELTRHVAQRMNSGNS